MQPEENRRKERGKGMGRVFTKNNGPSTTCSASSSSPYNKYSILLPCLFWNSIHKQHQTQTLLFPLIRNSSPLSLMFPHFFNIFQFLLFQLELKSIFPLFFTHFITLFLRSYQKNNSISLDNNRNVIPANSFFQLCPLTRTLLFQSHSFIGTRER